MSIIEEIEDECRICSNCKKKMYAGYVIEGGCEYYCSDDCLLKNMTRDEYNELYDDGDGDSYWTTFI